MRPAIRILIAASMALVVGASCDSDPADSPTVFVSGTAYVKGSTVPVEGGVVAIAEHPEISTVTDANGHWMLAVPDGASVTASLTHADFIPTYTETFTTAGEDIDRVHFQMIAPALFEVLAGMLGVVPDPGKCQLSTEVTKVDAQDKTLDELIAVRPHGVPDVTVSLSPPSGTVTYFAYGDPFDLPDQNLTGTSTSGGLVSTQVDPGVYTLTATHPTRTFESIKVTCVAGRFINATVPRGLHER